MADSRNIAVLNLGSQRVGGAVFGKTPGGDLILKRHAFSEMPGDPSVDATRLPQLKVAVEELVRKLKMSGSQVWCAVAGHTVFTRFVKLPPVQGEKMDQIVEFEARQNVPFPINEVIWDYETVGEKDAIEPEVVLVAMKADALNEINEQVESGGVKTAAMDLAPAALFNAFRYSYPDVDEPVVIVDLGARSTNLVFVENERLFTRNILVGGATVTTAIGREFGLGFGDAESQKTSQGFVAFGGAVEEHSDPAIAALSKVIRNAMTRLHGEVTRTITYYRSQQGGSAPKRVFLAGGGSALPGIVEFFQEKLKLPVEILNPLRGVQLDRTVSSQDAAADAPSMSELVGLALRGAGSCPIEVELLPESVAKARDAAKRSPALIMAMLCLFAALGAGALYFKSANQAVQSKIAALDGESAALKGHADAIRELDDEIEDLKGQSGQLEGAINARSWWLRLLTDLNSRFSDDLLWVTVVEPMKNDAPLTTELFTTPGAAAPVPLPQAPAVAPGAPQPPPKYQLRMRGLYRNTDAGQEVVYKFANALKASPFFDAEKLADLQQFVKADTGVEGERFAYKFEITLPLKQPIDFTIP